jgi:hypothetical protein
MRLCQRRILLMLRWERQPTFPGVTRKQAIGIAPPEESDQHDGCDQSNEERPNKLHKTPSFQETLPSADGATSARTPESRSHHELRSHEAAAWLKNSDGLIAHPEKSHKVAP